MNPTGQPAPGSPAARGPLAYLECLERSWTPEPAAAEPLSVPLPPELELQALWLDGQFGDRFKTTDGRDLRILQFGEWNRSAGPDFLHCAIELDGKPVAGPIELDLHPSDWEAHGHSTSKAFREVVLHVVFRSEQAESFARNCDHRQIPRVLVPPAVVITALELPQRRCTMSEERASL